MAPPSRNDTPDDYDRRLSASQDIDGHEFLSNLNGLNEKRTSRNGFQNTTKENTKQLLSNTHWGGVVSDLDATMLHIPGSKSRKPAGWGSTTLSMNSTNHQGVLQSDSALVTAWSMLLASYLGNKKVCFGYKSSDYWSAAGNASDGGFLVCEVQIDNSVTIDQTLHNAQKWHANALNFSNHSLSARELGLGSMSTAKFNTIVIRAPKFYNGTGLPQNVEKEVNSPPVSFLPCILIRPCL